MQYNVLHLSYGTEEYLASIFFWLQRRQLVSLDKAEFGSSFNACVLCKFNDYVCFLEFIKDKVDIHVNCQTSKENITMDLALLRERKVLDRNELWININVQISIPLFKSLYYFCLTNLHYATFCKNYNLCFLKTQFLRIFLIT